MILQNGNYGIFLLMGNAGFIINRRVLGLGFRVYGLGSSRSGSSSASQPFTAFNKRHTL